MLNEIANAQGDLLRYEYCQVQGSDKVIVMFGGYQSQMVGGKSDSIKLWCQEWGISFLRFDYSAHGSSEGNWKDCTLETWIEDARLIVNQCTEQSKFFIGSSMGAWVASHLSLETENMIGLVTIAGAFDFSKEVIKPRLTSAYKRSLIEKGYFLHETPYDDEPYKITQAFISSGENYLLFDREVNFSYPVILLHGDQDTDIPWHLSLRMSQHCSAASLQFKLLKGKNHRLCDDESLAILRVSIAEALGV